MPLNKETKPDKVEGCHQRKYLELAHKKDKKYSIRIILDLSCFAVWFTYEVKAKNLCGHFKTTCLSNKLKCAMKRRYFKPRENASDSDVSNMLESGFHSRNVFKDWKSLLLQA